MVIRKLQANNPVNRHVSGTLLSSAGLFEVRNGARAGTIYIKIDPHFSTPLVQPRRAVCTLEVDRPPNLGYISCQCPLPIAPTKESKLFTATPVYAFHLTYCDYFVIPLSPSPSINVISSVNKMYYSNLTTNIPSTIQLEVLQ